MTFVEPSPSTVHRVSSIIWIAPECFHVQTQNCSNCYSPLDLWPICANPSSIEASLFGILIFDLSPSEIIFKWQFYQPITLFFNYLKKMAKNLLEFKCLLITNFETTKQGPCMQVVTKALCYKLFSVKGL